MKTKAVKKPLLFYEIKEHNSLNIGGRNIISPIAAAINVANITAPAEISFAIPTRIEYLL